MQYRVRALTACFLTLAAAFIAPAPLAALDLSDPYINLSGVFDSLIDDHEGETAFRSLLIPAGGRGEAMGSAFTALASDIGFFESNPAGSATMENTELAVMHNNWIADSRLETLSFSRRSDVFGYGASVRCFYVPFTEYNTFGERVSRGYYTETFATLNVSYNFLAGYYFKGIATGMNLKVGFRGMPDFSDNEGRVQDGSGFEQSSFAVMADIGAQTRFNFLKMYNSREPNFFLGFAARNLGPPMKGEAMPTVFAFGLAYKPANPITVSGEYQQPLNLVDPASSGLPSFGAGVAVEFANFFTFLGGLQIKGANPRLSIGGEINVNDLQFNVNYTLDLTTQLALLNRVSLAAKINLGDRGRADKRAEVEKRYIEGLRLYANGQLEEAITVWNGVLELDKRFDPAREGVETASLTLRTQERIREIQRLE